jgi:bisphosphoglycerate-independent phosphoglycerate mutase (AlkP superfamily)
MSEGLKQKIQKEIDGNIQMLRSKDPKSERRISVLHARIEMLTWVRKELDEATKSPQLLEKLAELEHEQWIEWSKTVAPEIDVRYYMGRLKRWEKCWISYSKLTEEQKEHDRKWARKVLAVLEGKEKARA